MGTSSTVGVVDGGVVSVDMDMTVVDKDDV